MLLRFGFILFLGLFFYSNLTLGHSNIESRFLLAIELGEYNKVKNFLNHKIDVNVKGFYEQTALHIAAMRGDNRIVSLLLERSADIHAKDRNNLRPIKYAKKVVYKFWTSYYKLDCENILNISAKDEILFE